MARSLVDIATELSSRVSVPASVGTVQSDGTEHMFKSLAGDFSEVASRIGKIADHVTAVEGAKAGAEAGLDPEFRARGDGTIYSDAYDKAGLQIAATKAKQKLTASLAEAYDKSPNDPQALGEDIKKRTSGFIAGAPPEIRPQLILEAQHDALTYARQATRNLSKETAEATRAAFETEVSETTRRLHQRAFALGRDPQADEVLKQGYGQLDAVLQRRGLDGSLLIDPRHAEKVLESARETMTTARIMGAFDRIPSIEGKQDYIDKLKEDFGASTGLAKEYSLEKFEHLEKSLRSELRAAGTEGRIQSEGMAHSISQIEHMAKSGVYDEAAIRAVGTRVMATGHPELIEKFQRARATAQVLSVERNRPPEKMRAVSGEMRRQAAASGGSPRELGSIVKIKPGLLQGSRDMNIEGLSGSFTSSISRMLTDMPDELRQAIMIDEAHRSPGYQATLYDKAQRGEIAAAAKPGTSKHEAGEAIDIAPAGGWQAKTPEYQRAMEWVYANGAKYGIENPAGLRARDPAHLQRTAGYREDLSAFKRSEMLVHQADALDDLANRAEKGLKENQLGWAAQTGIAKVPPLDLAGAAKLSASLKDRFAVAEQVAAYYGRDTVYLQPDEKARIVHAAAPGGGALLDVVGAISTADPVRAKKVFAELWKDGSTTLGQIGGLASEIGSVPPVARDVADGVALQRTVGMKKEDMLKPSEKVARNYALAAHGGALSGSPTTEQALIDATNYAYAVRIQRKGKVEDPEEWKRTFRELAGERQVAGETWGGFTRHRDTSVIVPPDVKQSGFTDLVNAIEPGDFGGSGPRTAKGEATVKEIRQSRLEQVGNGRYYMNLGTAEHPQYLVDGGGRAFVLDVAALKPKLRERHPELYIDGKGGR